MKTNKPIIIILGRQHFGETPSSFIIHGLINFLLSRNKKAFKIREQIEFWILPVVNPDGIISGDYRYNTQGKDIKRSFFANDDLEAKTRLTEVEHIRSFMEENFSKKVSEKRQRLKMFLN